MTAGRFELKYVINAAQRARFLAACQSALLPDPHGQDAIYRVSSVYFDSPDFAAFWEKMDGEAIRSKYRLRFYSLDEESESIAAAFMEIKHRIHNTVYKQRIKLTSDGAQAILLDASALRRISTFIDTRKESDSAAIASVEQAAHQGLEAKTTITYLREAWLGRHDDRLRVTFDSAGQAYQAHQYALVASGNGESFLRPDQTILEVKFNQSIPRWIRDVLDSQNLVLNRFSKYAEGVRIPATQYAESLRRQAALEISNSGQPKQHSSREDTPREQVSESAQQNDAANSGSSRTNAIFPSISIPNGSNPTNDSKL
ncbi:MAG: polyphosphate polymerase domain-containing protein [Planctomycetota bacterium]